MIENQTTQQIAEILNRIKQLPGANLEPPQFFANFLQLSVAATGSRGGAIWLTQSEQGPQCYCHLEIERCGINGSDEQKRLIVEAVQRTVKEAKPLVVPPEGDSPASADTESSEEAAAKNRCPHPLFFYPLRAANQVAMVLQYIGSELISPSDYRTIVGLLSQVAEAAETFLAHRRAAVLEDDRKALARLLRFSEAVHGSLDAEKVIYQLANLGRETVGCTRMVVWVDPLVKRGLRAISGVDKPDRRAVLLQALEKLSRHCLRLQKPIVASREQLIEMPEEEDLTGLLKEYFNLSQLNQIFLQPLAQEDRALGVIIAEGFDETGGANLAGLMATVAKHGTLALTNALEMASVPWVRPLGRFQKAKKDPKKKHRWIAVGVILVAGLVACAFIPWTIQIDSNCRLTPRLRRVINAPLEGVAIARVVRSQGRVQAGELLVVLDDADLQAELAGLQAEQAQQRVRLNEAMGTADEEFYRLETKRLGHRIALVQQQIDKCRIKAPIAGTILTPELEKLENKTVERGELICELADLGQWELILEVPQEEVGWVQRALSDRNDVPVEFFLQAYPEYRLHATIPGIDAIGQMAQITEQGNVFEIRFAVPSESVGPIQDRLRDGSTGAAKIATVDRPLGFVLLRKVIRFFRVTFF